MPDVLDRLAARHQAGRRTKPSCPRCNQRTSEARLMVQAKRTTKKEGTRGEEIVASVVRTMCADCVAELFEQFFEALPERDASTGGRP